MSTTEKSINDINNNDNDKNSKEEEEEEVKPNTNNNNDSNDSKISNNLDNNNNNNSTTNNNNVFKNKDGKWSYYSDKEGIHYIYDEINKQWYPEITKEMVASQQSIYKKNDKKRDKNQELEENISELYISGLPLDGSIREQEIGQYFKKCGFIKKNEYGRPIINLCVDDNNIFTGNALISFERKESIPLAILQLDETEIAPNHPIKLRKATLEESQSLNNSNTNKNNNNNNNNNNNKKQKKHKGDKRLQYENELKYGWSDSESKTVIIKNLFSPEDAMEDPNFFIDLQTDLEDETHGCGKCGEISSIHIFEYNPDGVVSVKFKEFSSAESCVALMNGRFFSGRKLVADFYDGFTNYHVEETEENKEKRLKRWEQFISN